MKIYIKFVILTVNFSVTFASSFNSTEKNNNIHFNDTRSFNEFFKLTQNFIIDLDYENVSTECKESYSFFKNSLQNLEFWALNSGYSFVPQLWL